MNLGKKIGIPRTILLTTVAMPTLMTFVYIFYEFKAPTPAIFFFT